MRMSYLAKIEAKLTKKPLDQHFMKLVCEWTGGSYDHTFLKQIKQYDIPDKYRKAPDVIYRGERFDWHFKNIDGPMKVLGISWTTSSRVARIFAVRNDTKWGVIWKYKPKPQQVVLNVHDYIQDNLQYFKANCDNHKEREVVLATNLNLTKADIFEISRGEDFDDWHDEDDQPLPEPSTIPELRNKIRE